MPPELRDPSDLPGRWSALVFEGKAVLLRLRRALSELGRRPEKYSTGEGEAGAPVIGEARAKLWTAGNEDEFPLTAGKVENLRRAARALQPCPNYH